jgi:hypothetical protein
MTKLTLTKVSRFTTDKSGNPLKTKDGRPYTSVRVQSAEFGERWISGFEKNENKNWKEGDVVEVIIKENGQYLNFDLPKKEDIAHEEITGIKSRLGKLNFKVEELEICVEALAYKAGLKVKDLRALAEEAKRGYTYPVNDMPEPDFDPANSPF